MCETEQPGADLWWTLARAFMPPREPTLYEALREPLAESLAALLAEVPPAAACVAALPGAFGRFGNAEGLLVHYSRCFLAPPVAVPLSLGLYLDGVPAGPSLDGLERWMAACGVVRTAGFPEQPDHLASVLELLGLIEDGGEAGQAGDFARRFLLPALPAMAARFGDPALDADESPYRILLHILHAALRAAYPEPEAAAQRRPRYRERPVDDGWRRCRRCDAPIATEKELAVIETALQRQRLPTDHLTLCVDCRDAARGWTKRPLVT